MKKKRIYILLVAALLIVLSMLIVNLASYDLVITSNERETTIKTLSLGEYYTPVTELVISRKKNNKEILRITANNSSSRLHTITIYPESDFLNNANLDDYKITYDYERPLKLLKGEIYNVEVTWGKHKKVEEFVFN